MSYPYTKENRLEHPHKYMYTPFEGVALLEHYRLDRLEFVRRISADGDNVAHDQLFEGKALEILSDRFGESMRALESGHECLHGINISSAGEIQSCIHKLAACLKTFDSTKPVETLALLQAIIASQLGQGSDPKIKKWLDLLVQRFEVSKKIYSGYLAGFRKGDGQNDNVRLYWLFALALILHYAETRQIKYLSTLLKVMDLLCSLPDHALKGTFTSNAMSMIVFAELTYVLDLIKDEGIVLGS